MATCCISGCDGEVSPRSKLRACKNCRAYWHRWEKCKTPHILAYAQATRLRTTRMNTLAVVKDEEVVKTDRTILESKKLMTFPKSRKKARSNIVEFKLRELKRRKA
jgi:hypothetical protein